MSLEKFADQIPYYLTKVQGEGLLKELENYSDKTNLYLTRELSGILQGDCWSDLTIYDHYSKTTLKRKSVIISNSCDVDENNKRELPSKITFAPILRLSSLVNAFRDAGLSEQSISNKIADIRSQRVTQFFFLPKASQLDDDYVIWFSDLHSMPLAEFANEQQRRRMFSLNMVGFYLFLFKISIHFCRFHENVDRYDSR